MKTFVLSPNIKTLFSSKELKDLNKSGDLHLISEIKPLNKINKLYDKDAKVLAIDPDFCHWDVSNKEIDQIPNLKAVCLQTTSFSWLDVEHLAKKDIPVTNLRGFSTTAVSEWSTMMVLNLARKTPVIMRDNWEQDFTDHCGIELKGKTAGVVGMGRIGTAMAENMQGLGMNVQYWSKNSKDKRFKYVSLEKLMKSSDVILLALAKNQQTKGLITNQMLKSMKKSAIFVSVVHEIYDHEIVLNLAESGKIWGYGFETTNGNPAKYNGNIWGGPELAWCTKDSLRKNAEQWVESIVLASKGKYPNKVN